MTTKELTEIVSEHSLTLAEINHALAQITRNNLILHESIKGLEAAAELLLENSNKHDEVIANLEKQWQAYINRLPKT